LRKDFALSVSPIVNEQAEAEAQTVSPKSFWDSPLALPLLVAAFASLVPIWFSFEHRIPTIDESGHILNAFTYADLFKHPHLFRGEWWHQFLTVNSFYPPFAHMVNGFFKAVFGRSRAVDIAVLTLFNVILTLSVYGIGMRLTGSKLSSLVSALLINLYPELALLNRAFWLDFPLTAMAASALYALFDFRVQKTVWRAVFAGIVLGFACMTKQIAVAYLGLPFAAVFCECLIGKSKSTAAALKLIGAGVIGACISAPWFVLNAEKAKLMADECAAHITESQSFFGNLLHYQQVLPSMMSPLLELTFVAALLTSCNLFARQLYPLLLSAVGGVLAVSTLAWILPKPQYIAPALITTAVVSGWFLARRIEHPDLLLRRAAWIVIAAAVVQIFSLEFAPYPVSQPQVLYNFARGLGNTISEPRLGITLINPRPDVDWGQYWALRTIDDVDKHKQVWLNILSNSPDLNVHTFELLAHDLHSEVKPTTSRIYTIGGDTATFSPTQALYYQWYLIQSENHYQGFADANSEKAFEQLKQFVKTDSHFNEVASHSLPDGSSMTLYRQK
jgi:4-amino-4-deoxy-L-arabinose transferase-like glycosyltransferase